MGHADDAGALPGPPRVLRVCTFGIAEVERYGMPTRGVPGAGAGRPPRRYRLDRANSIEVYNALRANTIGAVNAMRDGATRDALIALVKVQRLGVVLARRAEGLRGRDVLVVEDDRDVTVVRIPADHKDEGAGG